MIIKRFWLNKVRYDIFFGLVGFGFLKYSFKKTSMTFLFDWTLRLGIICIQKWQSKKFNELKCESDKIWDEKWKKHNDPDGEDRYKISVQKRN